MYPLNAILIGRDESLLPHVRRELMNCSSQLEAEYPDIQSAVVALRTSLARKRLLVLHLGTPPELDALSRLGTSLPSWPVVVLMDEDAHPNTGRGFHRFAEWITAMALNVEEHTIRRPRQWNAWGKAW